MKLLANKTIDEINEDIESNEAEGLSQRFDDLGQDLISDNWEILTNLKKKGQKPSEDLSDELKIKMTCFRNISAVISVLKRQNRIVDKPNDDFDKQLLEKIKNKRSTVPSIVRSLKDDKE